MVSHLPGALQGQAATQTFCLYLKLPQRVLVKVIYKIKTVQVNKSKPPKTIAEAAEGVTSLAPCHLTKDRKCTLLVALPCKCLTPSCFVHISQVPFYDFSLLHCPFPQPVHAIPWTSPSTHRPPTTSVQPSCPTHCLNVFIFPSG